MLRTSLSVLGLFLGLAAPLMLCVSCGEDKPFTLSVSSERQVCSLLGQDAKNSRITGQDGGDSIKPDGTDKSFWTFGDTTIIGSGLFSPLSNNVAYTTDTDASDCLELVHKKTSGEAVELLSRIDDELAAWPDGMVSIQPGYVHLFYLSVENCKSCEPFPSYHFDIRGVGLAKFDIRSMNSTRIGGLIWDNSKLEEKVWYAHPVIIDSDAYVFLDIRDSQQRFVDVRLAKVPVSRLEDPSAYRYWKGGTDFSATSLSEAAGLWSQLADLNGVSVSHNQYLGKWLAVYTTGSGSNSKYDRVVGRTADQLTGPWSDEFMLIDCSEEFAGESGLLCYTGRQHPELEENGGQTIYISYASQHSYQLYLHEIVLSIGD